MIQVGLRVLVSISWFQKIRLSQCVSFSSFPQAFCYFYLHVCEYVCMNVCHMKVFPNRPKESNRFPGAEGTGSCELPSMGAGTMALWPQLDI